ncbi:hypothetical protein AB6A40_006850 [Gnathostoma spinigerum]|uniref:Solute carrier family 25 member 40 n=1 Tax=Gnathostoma spinigerum TaxID=75299 RepID=A0ABD6ERR2_9BILA
MSASNLNDEIPLPHISNGVSVFERIISASSGAALTSIMMTPLDVVKIRLQQQVHPFTRGACFLYYNGLMDHLCTACSDPSSGRQCEWFERPGHFKGTFDAFVKITRNEGIQSLWSGLSPTLIMAIPATVLYFSTYDHLLMTLRNRYGLDNVALPMLAGSSARFVSTTVVSPIEMVRTKMQSERMSYCDIGRAIQRSLANDGWKSFWRGWAPTLLRDLPFSAVYWTAYECFKARILQLFKKAETNFFISFGCGAIAGTIAATVTTPFDVVKTQRQITLGQIEHERSAVGKNRSKHSHSITAKSSGNMSINVRSESTYSIMREVTKTRGLAGLFAGIIPRIVKVAPSCAIMIGSYECAKIFFAHRRKYILNCET